MRIKKERFGKEADMKRENNLIWVEIRLSLLGKR